MGDSSILPESESINITIQEKDDETEIPGTKLDQDVYTKDVNQTTPSTTKKYPTRRKSRRTTLGTGEEKCL